MTIDKNKAREYTCPFHNGMCNGDMCMAWEFDETDELDIERTKKRNKGWDESQDRVSDPVFKKSETMGYCLLMEKDCF